MIHEHSAGSIVYRRESGDLKYLLVQSVVHHTWGFPKGHLAPDETEQEAAKREVAEEVGLHPDFDFNFKESTTYETEEHTIKTVTFFVSEYVPGQKVVDQKEEILNSTWVTLPEAKEYLKRPGLYDILQKAEAYIQLRD